MPKAKISTFSEGNVSGACRGNTVQLMGYSGCLQMWLLQWLPYTRWLLGIVMWLLDCCQCVLGGFYVFGWLFWVVASRAKPHVSVIFWCLFMFLYSCQASLDGCQGEPVTRLIVTDSQLSICSLCCIDLYMFWFQNATERCLLKETTTIMFLSRDIPLILLDAGQSKLNEHSPKSP